MIDLEKIGREMPYKMPDHFIENLTERVIAEVKQPAKKKIKITLYMKPIFEIGDVVAFQLQTTDKTYLSKNLFQIQYCLYKTCFIRSKENRL